LEQNNLYGKWTSGTGKSYGFDNVCNDISAHVSNNGKIFIGTDSFIAGSQCIFATAICLHGATGQSGGRYFFKRSKSAREDFPKLLLRMLREAQDSIMVAIELSELFPGADVEIHLDIGSGTKSKTSKFISALTSYAKSAGFKCKIKPHAWASASVADKHSKQRI
tara:strand:+ start:1803 stop:2297 length:495 start_codon:yes stop_codon:yes gene_type:complete